MERRDRNAHKKFKGSFTAASKMGADYENGERFKPLSGKEGKPLWEFKEFAHRLYCFRRQRPNSKVIDVVLLNGWTKEKEGKTERESREIETAQRHYQEFLQEFPGGCI